MSDYFGNATLEDWLAEEVFGVDEVQPDIVKHFEKWREAVEANIEGWMDTDDGDGNNDSWRGWGRGFYAIPDEEDKEFVALVKENSR